MYILIYDTKLDSEELKDLKRNMYHLSYMDNVSFSCDDSGTMVWAYQNVKQIFGKFNMSLQQFSTNSTVVKELIDEVSDEESGPETKLFGLNWDTLEDTLEN